MKRFDEPVAESDDSIDGLFGSDGLRGILADDGADGIPPGEGLPQVDAFHSSAPWNKAFGSNPRIEAHAAGRAHAAYRDAGAGSYPYPRAMNVVITFGDAARTFAYRGINALARKLYEIAERIAPSR